MRWEEGQHQAHVQLRREIRWCPHIIISSHFLPCHAIICNSDGPQTSSAKSKSKANSKAQAPSDDTEVEDRWLTKYKTVEDSMYQINGAFVPSAVAKLGPAMAESSKREDRENLFGEVLVELGFYDSIEDFHTPGTVQGEEVLSQRYRLVRAQLQTWEQVSAATFMLYAYVFSCFCVAD